MMKQKSLQPFMWLSIAAALVTIVLKYYAYMVTDSMGFMSDALESFVNLLAAVFALIMLKLAAKPADAKHEFGHSKAEYFSSATEGALILIASFSIIWSSVPRLINPLPIENISTGLIFSALASIINLLVGIVLIRVGKQQNSLLLEANGRHLMTDVLTTVGVIAGIIMVHYTGWYIIDPIIATLVAINILYIGYKLIGRSASGLMDASIPEEDIKKITDYLDTLKSKNIHYHSLLTRVAGQRKFIILHVLVPGEWSVKKGHDYADEIEETIVNMFSEPVTVNTHLEPVDDPVSQRDIGIDRKKIEYTKIDNQP